MHRTFLVRSSCALVSLMLFLGCLGTWNLFLTVEILTSLFKIDFKSIIARKLCPIKVLFGMLIVKKRLQWIRLAFRVTLTKKLCEYPPWNLGCPPPRRSYAAPEATVDSSSSVKKVPAASSESCASVGSGHVTSASREVSRQDGSSYSVSLGRLPKKFRFGGQSLGTSFFVVLMKNDAPFAVNYSSLNLT